MTRRCRHREAPVAANEPVVDAAIASAAPAVPDVAIVAEAAAPASSRQAAGRASDAPTAEVRTVMFGTDEPVAYATVWFLPPEFDWSKLGVEQRDAANADNAAFTRRSSSEVRTDAEGRCRVPIGPRGTMATAEKGELFGRSRGVMTKDGPNVIALRRDRSLRVLVLDANGRPARGVRVEARRGGAREMQFTIGNEVTDADGRVVHHHVQDLAGDEATAVLDLEAKIAGGSSPAVAVEVTAPPPDVTLHLPPTGVVAVHVRDAAGKPFAPSLLGNPTVELQTWNRKPTEASDRRGRNGDVLAPIDANGEAVVEHVALGLHVQATITFSQSEVVSGPTLENRRVELLLAEGVDNVILEGVLVGPDGRPLAEQQLMVTCTGVGGTSGQNGRTGPLGRFRIALGDHPGGREGTLTFKTGVGQDVNSMTVELPPRKLEKGVNDLGSVRVVDAAVIVAGRVAVGDGSPAPRIQMHVERRQEQRWQQEWNLNPIWTDGGKFAFRSGIAKDTPLRLVMRPEGYLPVEPIEFAAGAKDLEIVLQKGGSIAATFFVDDSVPIDRIELHCRRTEPPPKRLEFHERMMESVRMRFGPVAAVDGRLRREWGGLLPGRYRLEARCGGAPTPIATVDALVVADGPCVDPRLDGIDLRGKVTKFSIRATGPDGAPIASRDAHIVVRGDAEQWQGFNLGAGVVELVSPTLVDLIVVADGCKTAFVNGVFDSRTIVMEAAPKQAVRFELPDDLPADTRIQLYPRPAIDLPKGASLQFDTGRGISVESLLREQVTIDATGRGDFGVRLPGEHSLGAAIRIGDRSFGLRGVEPSTAKLPVQGELVLRIPDAEWKRVRAAIAK